MKNFNDTFGFYIIKVRALEQKALEAGLLEKSDIKSLSEMRFDAWQSYLVSRCEYLESLF